MDYRLRKSHKFYWILLLLVMPFLMFFAIKNIPTKVVSSKSISENSVAKEPLIETYELKDVIIRTRGNNNRIAQVEIEITHPLKTPSAVVYAITDSGEKSLGAIYGKGIYVFQTESISGVKIMDGIKNQELFKTVF